MNNSIDFIEEFLCKSLCSNVSIKEIEDNEYYLSTPFNHVDGDSYSIFLRQLPWGWRLSDKGTTLMHLSYDFDVDKLLDGNRGRLFNQILSEIGLENNNGELYIEFSSDVLGESVFQFGQALTRIHDLNFLNRIQVENTFYDDLDEVLTEMLGERLQRNYLAEVPNSEYYPVDYAVLSSTPLYIFGVSNKEKAKLTTIILQHFQKIHHHHKSLIIYSDMFSIPKPDLKRLVSTANEQVPSLNESDDLRRKISEAIE